MLTAYLILPTLRTLYISFFDSRSVRFVGLKNYAFALTNPRYGNCLSQQPAVVGIGIGD